jgi:hypothetical protein
MSIYEIRLIASKMDIDPKKLNKKDLIGLIQIKEGKTPCFKSADTYCDQADCLWKSDCLR